MSAHGGPVLGIVLPLETLQMPWFAVLAAFVAVNTVMYVALAVATMLPKVYLRDYAPRRYQRSQTRSIHPEGHPLSQEDAR